MKQGRFRGTWHNGWSYSLGDTVICDSAYYKAKSDRPCYDIKPSSNDEWEWLHDCQSKNNEANKR